MNGQKYHSFQRHMMSPSSVGNRTCRETFRKTRTVTDANKARLVRSPTYATWLSWHSFHAEAPSTAIMLEGTVVNLSESQIEECELRSVVHSGFSSTGRCAQPRTRKPPTDVTVCARYGVNSIVKRRLREWNSHRQSHDAL